MESKEESEAKHEGCQTDRISIDIEYGFTRTPDSTLHGGKSRSAKCDLYSLKLYNYYTVQTLLVLHVKVAHLYDLLPVKVRF